MKFLAALTAAGLAAGLPTYEQDAGANTLSTRSNDVPYGNKKGLAYNDPNIIKTLSQPGSATWAYNWGPALDADGFQGIPMCWGAGINGDCYTDGIMAKMDKGDTPWVLGYNEPDMTKDHGGCHLSPQQAYDQWGNDMFKFQERGAKLVCPGISSYDTPDSMFTGYASGLEWLNEFANLNNNPDEFRCDAQSLHWYGVEGTSGAGQAELFIEYMNYAHDVVNEIFRRDMPIWVTEFAPLPVGNAQVMSEFLDVAVPWLNAQDWVHRYSPFMAEHLVENGNPNQAGMTFINRS